MARANDHDSRETGEPQEVAGRGLLDAQSDERAGGLPELLRRLMTLGFSGLFTTEAAIRGALGDTVPREWVDFIADQSERTRDEFISRLAQEFARVLESVDLVALAEQLLEGRTVEVNAQFRLQPREVAPQAGRVEREQPSSDRTTRRSQDDRGRD